MNCKYSFIRLWFVFVLIFRKTKRQTSSGDVFFFFSLTKLFFNEFSFNNKINISKNSHTTIQTAMKYNNNIKKTNYIYLTKTEDSNTHSWDSNEKQTEWIKSTSLSTDLAILSEFYAMETTWLKPRM